MKNKKGVTLIALVITILVLLILATVATYSGIDIIKSSKLTAFTTQMKIMQSQVNSIYDKAANSEVITIDGKNYEGNEIFDLGKSDEQISEEIKTKKSKIFNELSIDSSSGVNIEDKNNYRYWDNDLVKKLGIEGVEQDFFINLQKRSIVSYSGVEYNGKVYYTLSQLPDSLYNVQYENTQPEKPTFELSVNAQNQNRWRINVFNIQYNGYINKWKVKYKLEEASYWSTSEDLSFVVGKHGNYIVKIFNGNVESEEVNIKIKDKVYSIKNGDETTYYETFKEAYEASVDNGGKYGGGTIVVERDVTEELTEYLEINKTITIDLNLNTMKMKTGIDITGGTLTVTGQDSGTKIGTIECTDDLRFLTIYNNASINITGNPLIKSVSHAIATYGEGFTDHGFGFSPEENQSRGTLNIQGGYIVSTERAAIGLKGNRTSDYK